MRMDKYTSSIAYTWGAYSNAWRSVAERLGHHYWHYLHCWYLWGQLVLQASGV